MNRTATFTSRVSSSDATMKCKMAGYNPIRVVFNKARQEFVCFGRWRGMF